MDHLGEQRIQRQGEEGNGVLARRQKEAIEQSYHAIKLAPNSEKASLIHFHALWKAAMPLPFRRTAGAL
jgi:hypothetical protein